MACGESSDRCRLTEAKLPMLTFGRYPDDWNNGRKELVDVNPRLVASVREAERQEAHGGSSPVAVIVMNDGDEFVVYDLSRAVASQIAVAQNQSAGNRGG
jgi:hypothetical protein